VLAVAHELGRRVSEARARLHHPDERASARLIERVAQPILSGPFREVAGRRTTALRPRRPQLLLHLPSVRQPVLRVPGQPTRPFDSKNVPRGGSQRPIHVPRPAGSGDILGTRFTFRPDPENEKAQISWAFPARPERFELPTFGS
jgi:hypothetical protein